MKKKKILWLEDYPEVFSIKREALIEAFPDFEVKVVDNLDDAWDIVKREHGNIALVIIDMMMRFGVDMTEEEKELAKGGEWTGLVLIKRIREKNYKIKIAVFTVVRDQELKKKLKEFEVDLILYKPIDVKEFIEKINNLKIRSFR